MKRIIEFGTYALVFFLPWQTRWIFQQVTINGNPNEFLTLSLYGFDLLLIAMLVLALIYFRKNIFTITFINSFMDVRFIGLAGVFLFVVIGAVSIFFAENKSLAWFFEVRLLLAVGFSWLLFKFGNKLKLTIAFVFSLILPTILALWQFFGQQTIANKWLGLADHLPASGGSAVIEIYLNGIVQQRWLRAYGSFDHPNILGTTLVIGVVLGLWLLIQKWEYKILIFTALILFSAGIFVSFSRAAWLALFLALVAGAIWLLVKKEFIDLKVWLYGAVVIAAVFLISFLNYRDLVGVRANGGTRLENLSLDQRTLFLHQAIELIKQNPITGVGIGNYIPNIIKANPGNEAWLYQPVHIVALLIFAELGILGFVLLVVALIFLFWNFAKNDFAAVSLFAAILPSLMLDHWLWSLHFGLMLCSFVTALIVGISKQKQV